MNDMQAVVAIIAANAAIFATLITLGNRALRAELKSEIGGKLDTIGAKFDTIDVRLTALETDMTMIKQHLIGAAQ